MVNTGRKRKRKLLGSGNGKKFWVLVERGSGRGIGFEGFGKGKRAFRNAFVRTLNYISLYVI